MKKNVNTQKEPQMDVISVKNDFGGFGYEDDIFENFETQESPIETINGQKLDKKIIDEFVNNLDYMWIQEYLDSVDDDLKHEILEYIENNYPEFFEDEEWNLLEPMKWWKINTDKEIVDNFNKKSDFDKNIVKSELTATLDSYKNAA